MRMSPDFSCENGANRYSQWGNILTLMAAYKDPILKSLIEKGRLVKLLHKTLAFLKLVGQPSSALFIDYRILEYCGRVAGLIPELQAPNTSSSFSSNASGDVATGGH
jgi:hypothetical protein